MSKITGSLCADIRAFHQAHHSLAALIIDEQDEDENYEMPAQRQVLNTVRQLGIPVWHVELNPEINEHNPPANTPTTEYLAVPGARVLTKPHINAFASNAHPNLHQQLQKTKTSMLIVMGYCANQCVKATSVGGPDRPNGLHRPGATQLGYTVLTCDQIIRGGTANWKLEKGTRFYSAV